MFAFLSVRMPECERDYACQRIHVCAYVCTRSHLHPTGHMCHARATEGVQLSSFVLSMGHHLIPGQSRDETGPLKPLRAIVLSLSDKWEAGVHVWEGFQVYMPGPFHFHSSSVDLQQNTNVYDPKCAQENHLIPNFFRKSFLLSLPYTLFLPASLLHFTPVQHKTLCSYYKVSRAHKSL